MKPTMWLVVLISAFAVLAGAAQNIAGHGVPVADAERSAASNAFVSGSADLRAIRSQIAQFQQVLNQDLQQTFEHPFALLQDAKGTYLPGFGIAFHMELNLAPMRTLSPFDVRPYTEEELRKTRDAKLARISQLKDRLRDLLQQHAGDFGSVPEGQSIAIVVHLFNLPSEQTEGLPSQLVMEVPARVLLEFKARKLTSSSLAQSLTVLEF